MLVSAAPPIAPPRPARRRTPRRRVTPPAATAVVVIASTGEPVPPAAISRAMTLSSGQPVAVVSVAQIHRSALGPLAGPRLPAPAEMSAHRALVTRALADLAQAGGTGRGQAGASRRPGRAIAGIARARGARHVVVVVPARPRWRRAAAGTLIRELSRCLAAGTAIETITP